MGIAERKEREKQQRREEIIRAAERVFFARGFAGATMDEIAERAELSKGTLYLYFSSKDDLYMAVAREGIKLLRKQTNAAVDRGRDALEKLLYMGRACVEFSRSNPDHMNSIITLDELTPEEVTATADDVRDLIYKESTVGSLLQVIEQGVKEGLIRNDLPDVLIANTLWMSVLSVIRFVSRENGLLEMLDLSPEKVYESHFEMVINGIRT